MQTKLILSLLMVWAGTARAELTLSNAVAMALTGNPELQAARQQIEAATGRAIQARAWPNPELELSAEDMPASDVGLARSKNMLGVSQTVPFPGKKSLDGRIGRSGISAAENEYRGRERTLVRAAKSAFYRVLAAEQKVGVSGQLLDLAESLAKVAGKRVEAGATGAQESLRAEIEQERARLELAAARRDSTEARQELATLLGRPSEPLGALQGELSAVAPAVDGAALLQNPDLRATRANRERAELEWRRARLDPLPDVTLGVAGGRDAAVDENLLEFRVTLPLPLFDRGQGRKRETRALAEMARYDLTAAEQRLARDFAVTEARLRAAGEQVEVYRTRILPKAEEALKLVRGGFEAGKFGFLDLVDTQRTLAEARLAYLDKLLELNLAGADLEALAGTNQKE
ncbi:MAG: TolC family protein [Verrucomicrobiota bacterium]